MALYASTAQIKAALRITDAVDDTLINMAGSAASELINGYCGRSFENYGTATRYFAPNDLYVLQVDDLAGTAITIQSSSNADAVFDVTFAAKDYQLEPLNSISEGLTWPFTRIRAVDDYDWSVFGDEATAKITGGRGLARGAGVDTPGRRDPRQQNLHPTSVAAGYRRLR